MSRTKWNIRDVVPKTANGVEVRVEGEPPALAVRCQRCGREWRPKVRPDGGLPRYWFACPTEGCGADELVVDPDLVFRRLELTVKCAEGVAESRPPAGGAVGLRTPKGWQPPPAKGKGKGGGA
jgi:hypothetical protein